jgi:CoA-transferase family III
VTDAAWQGLLGQAWSAVAGETAVPAELMVDGPPIGELPSTLPVADAALACTGTALLAALALGRSRSGASGRSGARQVAAFPAGQVAALRAEQVAAAVRSEAYLLVDGEPLGPGFAPLSRFWRTADGWVRTHANYPWHREALLAALGTDADGVGAALAELPAAEAEQRVVDAGGVAAALRSPEQWLAHPHGRVVAGQPLVTHTHFDTGGRGEAGNRRREAGNSREAAGHREAADHRGSAGRPGGPYGRPGGPRAVEPVPLPASGVRVLDLTRVIAGPVATRYLAALGADVLRLDHPERPELPLHRYDGLVGKRSALLDAATPDGSARLHELLAGADVLVHGYRPGALARFGLDGAALAERHPGLVVVAMSAWGSQGPWGDRRGFDSIVQTAVGIAARESPAGDPSAEGSRPGALPCQLLDHGTGYLCAAAALDGLRRRAESGGTWLRELSLARTAHWLLAQPATERRPPVPATDTDWLTEVASADGPVTTVTPPGSLDGTSLSWPGLSLRYGTDAARWSCGQSSQRQPSDP